MLIESSGISLCGVVCVPHLRCSIFDTKRAGGEDTARLRRQRDQRNPDRPDQPLQRYGVARSVYNDLGVLGSLRPGERVYGANYRHSLQASPLGGPTVAQGILFWAGGGGTRGPGLTAGAATREDAPHVRRWRAKRSGLIVWLEYGKSSVAQSLKSLGNLTLAAAVPSTEIRKVRGVTAARP